ncbi:formate hydrogenlyase maturation HycH family protein [Shigella flexneri]
MTEECGEIVFWDAAGSSVASSDEMPETASGNVLPPAIGHHVGVIDCLNVAFRCPLTEYEDWLAQVPRGASPTQDVGVMTFGEIVIHASRTALLTRIAPLANTTNVCVAGA